MSPMGETLIYTSARRGQPPRSEESTCNVSPGVLFLDERAMYGAAARKSNKGFRKATGYVVSGRLDRALNRWWRVRQLGLSPQCARLNCGGTPDVEGGSLLRFRPSQTGGASPRRSTSRRAIDNAHVAMMPRPLPGTRAVAPVRQERT